MVYDQAQRLLHRCSRLQADILYKQILSIRIPKLNQDTSAFIVDVAKLGELPMTETADQIEIVAYQ